MHGVPVGDSGRPAGKALFFAEYKSAACHHARNSACNRSHCGIRLVTIQSKLLDHAAGGSGAVGPWPPPKALQRPASAVAPARVGPL